MWNWFNNLLDRFESRLALWLWLSGNFAVTGAGAYIAAVTDWMSVWGPVGYLAVGLSSALAVSTCFFLAGLFLDARARREANIKRAEKSTRINILKDSFEDEIIEIADIWSVQHQMLSGKRFHRCRFSGPMVLAFMNNVTASGFKVTACNFIEIGSSSIHGVVGLQNCTLTECEYDNVTFIIHESVAGELRKAFGSTDIFVSLPERLKPKI